MITTWKGKNRRLIEEAMREASRRGMKRPTLIDIAPGAVTRLLSPYFQPQAGLTSSLLGSLDKGLRLTGGFPVVCHEIEEILEVFTPMEPAHLSVLYADEDVASAVPESDLILMNPADINRDALLEIGDVVFCYNAISKSVNPKRSLENLLHSVKMGGLLSIDSGTDWSLNPRTDPLFIGITENLFVKEF
jgi:hypothetical protein